MGFAELLPELWGKDGGGRMIYIAIIEGATLVMILAAVAIEIIRIKRRK